MSNNGMLTASRVVDTRKPITSRSGVDKAVKARNTLYTAMTILRTSGNDYAADKMGPDIVNLNKAIRIYYEGERARKESA